MKTVLKTSIIIIIVLFIVSIGWFSNGFRNWNLEEWKNTWNDTFKDPASEEDGDSNPEIEESAINLNMSTSTEGSVTVTATITPSTATNKKVDWALAWKNPESTWANGKTVTDYVTVTPSADGALTATVKALKAFSEQIILTCTSRENQSVNSTCTIDYSKKITELNVSLKKDGAVADGIFWSTNGSTYDIEYTAVYTDYTIDEEFSFTCSITGTSEFVESVQVSTTFIGSDGSSIIEQNLITRKTTDLPDFKIITSYQNLTDSYFYFRNGSNAATVKGYVQAVNTFKKNVSAYTGVMFNLKITASNAYSSFEKTLDISSTGADFSVSVENVALSDSSIIF